MDIRDSVASLDGLALVVTRDSAVFPAIVVGQELVDIREHPDLAAFPVIREHPDLAVFPAIVVLVASVAGVAFQDSLGFQERMAILAGRPLITHTTQL